MMQQLHVRLAIALALLMTLIGGAFYWIESSSSQLYHHELLQRINAPIAMYIADAEPLLTNGQLNTAGLKTLTERAMVINPAAEIYVLSPAGEILGSGVALEGSNARSVDILPIRDLLNDQRALPILGDDPLDPGATKVFSAHPIMHNGLLSGYVYVVLGGRQYVAAMAQVASGYQQRMVVAGIALAIIAALVIGIAMFWGLTRPLRNLTTRMGAYRAADDSQVKPLQSNAGELTQLADTFTSMSARIDLQVDRIRESDRLRRELITNVSHDLRTPLAAMQGYLDTLLIKDGDLSSAQKTRLLEVARKHCGRLGQLIQDLFVLTRLDTGSLKPSFERFSLAELVNDVAQEFELRAAEKNIVLGIQPPTAGTEVVADIALIQRVLENLIDNAIKYTARGGEVSISVTTNDSRIGIAVADDGPGIAQMHLPKIFERDYQVDSHTNDASSGLGLAIVKKILELHDSTIAVHSVEQQGSRFSFELPSLQIAA